MQFQYVSRLASKYNIQCNFELKSQIEVKFINDRVRPQKKKKNLFYGRADLSSRVGRSVGRFFFIYLFLVAKMTIKTQTFRKKNLTFFEENKQTNKDKQKQKQKQKRGNILTYFQKNLAKIFRFWSKKKRLILQDFGKLRKKWQNGKFGSVEPVKQFFFFFFVHSFMPILCMCIRLLITSSLV